MATWYVNNSDGRTFWQANHAYIIGDRCCTKIENGTSSRRGQVYECTTGGTSGGTEPSWAYGAGNTTNDNTVVWTTRVPSSWFNAHPSMILMLSYPEFGLANGDIIKVHDAHNEDVGSTDGYGDISFRYGTPASPIIIVCVDKDNSDALSSGAIVRNRRSTKRLFLCPYTVSINMQYIFDGFLTSFGWDDTLNLTFISIGSPLTVLKMNSASSYLRFEGLYSGPRCQNFRIINSNLEMTDAANYITMNSANFEWFGGSLVAGSGVTSLFKTGTFSSGRIFIEDVDLSAIGANDIITGATQGGAPVDFTFSRCKIPAGLTGIMVTDFTATGYQGKVKLHHCSASNRTWEFYEHSVEGDIEASNAIYRSGGASDGTTSISWKIVSSTAADELGSPVKSPDIVLWNTSISSITLTIHGVWDSATNLQDDEAWVEISYPADASSGLGTYKTTHKMAPYEAASDLTASTETWVGTGGFSNENKFKFTATFTPGKAGPISSRICLGKPSTTIYICPKAEIS